MSGTHDRSGPWSLAAARLLDPDGRGVADARTVRARLAVHSSVDPEGSSQTVAAAWTALDLESAKDADVLAHCAVAAPEGIGTLPASQAVPASGRSSLGRSYTRWSGLLERKETLRISKGQRSLTPTLVLGGEDG